MTSIISVICGDCNFPSYLLTEDGTPKQWLHRLRHQGALSEDSSMYRVTFNGSAMSAAASNHGVDILAELDSYENHCIEGSGSRFVVSHTRDGLNIKTYRCIEFSLKSRSVVLLLMGAMTVVPVNLSTCLQETLVSDGWPLISHLSDDYIHNLHSDNNGELFQADATGYDAILSNLISGELWCAHPDQHPARLELGCGTDVTYTFTFSEDCKPPVLQMTSVQALYPLAKWNTYGYTFIVLKAVDMRHFWCLRYVTPSEETTAATAILFLDVVCDVTDDLRETDNYYLLYLSKRVSNESCGDNVNVCKVHESYQRPPYSSNPCAFPEEFRGQWLSTEATVFSIQAASVTQAGSGSHLTCAYTDNTIIHNRYATKYYDSNGCTPNIVCLELSPVQGTSSVIMYRLGKTYHFPNESVSLDRFFTAVCGNASFLSPADSGANIEPKAFNFLLHQHYLEYAPCTVFDMEWMYLFHEIVEDGVTCQGVMSRECHDPWQVSVIQSDCPDWQPQSFICLGYVSGRPDVTVIMKDADRGYEADRSCWIFNENRNKLIIKPFAECHFPLKAAEQSGRILDIVKERSPGRCYVHGKPPDPVPTGVLIINIAATQATGDSNRNKPSKLTLTMGVFVMIYYSVYLHKV